MLAVLVIGAALGSPADVALAEAHLAAGRPRLAVAALRPRMDDGATARSRVVLGTALQAIGRCAESLAVLAPARGGRAWTWRAAATEARCRTTLGDHAGALVAWDEAAQLGGPVALERALAGVRAGSPRPRPDGALWRAAAGLRTGAADDGAIVELLRDPATRGVGHLLDGLRWLELDDPVAALDAFRRAASISRTDPRPVLWAAESLRRLGDLPGAEAQLARPAVALGEPSALSVAVRARVAVDRGRPADLGDWPDDPQIAASRWYAARTDDLASAWAALPGRVGGELPLLVPVTDR